MTQPTPPFSQGNSESHFLGKFRKGEGGFQYDMTEFFKYFGNEGFFDYLPANIYSMSTIEATRWEIC